MVDGGEGREGEWGEREDEVPMTLKKGACCVDRRVKGGAFLCRVLDESQQSPLGTAQTHHDSPARLPTAQRVTAPFIRPSTRQDKTKEGTSYTAPASSDILSIHSDTRSGKNDGRPDLKRRLTRAYRQERRHTPLHPRIHPRALSCSSYTHTHNNDGVTSNISRGSRRHCLSSDQAEHRRKRQWSLLARINRRAGPADDAPCDQSDQHGIHCLLLGPLFLLRFYFISQQQRVHISAFH